MGSTGSGRFTDYAGTNTTATSSGGSGTTGGTSGIDKCGQAFSSQLEEVAQCGYYTQTKTVPVVGTELRLIFENRIFAITSNGAKVGALPTSFNYLAACLKNNFNYTGVVTMSATTPMPTLVADFAAS